MKKQILFIQGAGEGAYDADKLLANSLQQQLGEDYEVIYPAMPDEGNAPYNLWKETLISELAKLESHIILVGHSVGASVVAKFLSEVELERPPVGVFLIANPFWGGDGWLYEGYEDLELPKDLSKKLQDIPTFLYHCIEDAVVPFDHLKLYSQLLPNSTVREIPNGNHQLNNDLSVVAKDIKDL